MAKNKKKRPADTRLKVIAGGGAPKAVLPGKGPPSKRPSPSLADVAATTAKTESSARGRLAATGAREARETSAAEASAAEDLRLSRPTKKAGLPRNYLYAGLAAVALVVLYLVMTRGSATPTKQDVGVAAPSGNGGTSAASTTSGPIPATSASMNGAAIVLTTTGTASSASALVVPTSASVAPSVTVSVTVSATVSAAPSPKPAAKPATPPPAPVDDYQ